MIDSSSLWYIISLRINKYFFARDFRLKRKETVCIWHALGQWLASKSFKTSGEKRQGRGGGVKRKAGNQNVCRKNRLQIGYKNFLQSFMAATFFSFFLFFFKHQNTSHACVAEIISVVFTSFKVYDLFSTTCSMFTSTIPKIASQSRSNIVVICSLYWLTSQLTETAGTW